MQLLIASALVFVIFGSFALPPVLSFPVTFQQLLHLFTYPFHCCSIYVTLYTTVAVFVLLVAFPTPSVLHPFNVLLQHALN